MRAPLTLLLCLGCGNASSGKHDAEPTAPTWTPTEPSTTQTTTPTLPWPEQPATLVQGGTIDCAEPGLRASGWWRRKEFAAQPHGVNRFNGGGMAIGDFDGNGRPDIFIPADDTVQFWFQTEAGAWTEQAAAVLPNLSYEDTGGAAAADYDGDGDLDLFIARDRHPDILLRNMGGVFQDATKAAGLDGDRELRSMAASWADWDLDGDLDLSISIYQRDSANQFWENNGDGTFVERPNLLPDSVTDGVTLQITWHDLNHDGYPEVFVANDLPDAGADPMLFSNLGGVFVEDSGAGYHPDWDGMGVTVADFNGDLVPDLAETTWRDFAILMGTPSAAHDNGLFFVDSSAAMGISKDWVANDQRFSWGVDVGDLDCDRDLDIAATWGHFEHGAFQIPEQPDSLWIWNGSQFEETEMERGVGRALLFTDLDGDGWLDMTRRQLDEPTLIDFGRCDDSAWLTVRVDDVESSLNRHGIGVTVLVESEGQTMVRWIDSGSRSMNSSGPPQVHFGLGSAQTVDRVEVRWPDGRVAAFPDVPTKQHLRFQMTEPGIY